MRVHRLGTLKVGEIVRSQLTVQLFHYFESAYWFLSLNMGHCTTRGCPELGKFNSIQYDGRVQLTPQTLEETGHPPHWWLYVNLCPFQYVSESLAQTHSGCTWPICEDTTVSWPLVKWTAMTDWSKDYCKSNPFSREATDESVLSLWHKTKKHNTSKHWGNHLRNHSTLKTHSPSVTGHQSLFRLMFKKKITPWRNPIYNKITLNV